MQPRVVIYHISTIGVVYMSKLSNFIYCLSAERNISPDGKSEMINAVGVLSAITPEFVPGAFSFSIVFSIVDLDTKTNNRIRIVFSDNEGKAIVDTNEIALPIINSVDSLDIPNEYKGINMSMDLRNIVFEREGLYKTTVCLNGNMLGENVIYVKGKR